MRGNENISLLISAVASFGKTIDCCLIIVPK